MSDFTPADITQIAQTGEPDDPKRNLIPSGLQDLDKLLAFTVEIDKMTHILRRTLLCDASRRENDAEHSWHIGVMALTFKDYFPEPVNVEHAAAICIAHDLIEVYAGDTFAYDAEANKGKEEREQAAADRLFGMLPPEAGRWLRSLWDEFEAMETAESRYANCMDRIQPFLHNTVTEGHTWKLGVVRASDVRKRGEPISNWMPALQPWFENCIEKGIRMGWIKPE